jgi:rhodanese-related sulfurtransferase
MSRRVGYKSASEVAALLRMDRTTKILDVRDDDYRDSEGHIRGAVNVPVWDLVQSTGALDEFVHAHLKRCTTSRVVVHCYLSQQRGPLAAARIAERLSQLDSPELIGPEDVFILKQGWRKFWALYRDDEDLVVAHNDATP